MPQEYSRDIDLLAQNIMFDLRPAIYNALMSRLKPVIYQYNEEAIKEIIDTTIKTLQINPAKDTVTICCVHCQTSHKVSLDVYDRMSFCPFCGIEMKKPSLEETNNESNTEETEGDQNNAEATEGDTKY